MTIGSLLFLDKLSYAWSQSPMLLWDIFITAQRRYDDLEKRLNTSRSKYVDVSLMKYMIFGFELKTFIVLDELKYPSLDFQSYSEYKRLGAVELLSTQCLWRRVFVSNHNQIIWIME